MQKALKKYSHIKNRKEFKQGLVVAVLGLIIGIYFFNNLTTYSSFSFLGALVGVFLVYAFKMVYDSFDTKTENSPVFRTILVLAVAVTVFIWFSVFFKQLFFP